MIELQANHTNYNSFISYQKNMNDVAMKCMEVCTKLIQIQNV